MIDIKVDILERRLKRGLCQERLFSKLELIDRVTVFTFFLDRIRSERITMDMMEDAYFLESCLSDRMSDCDSLNIEGSRISFFANGQAEASFDFADSMIIMTNTAAQDTFRLKNMGLHCSYLSDKTRLVSNIGFTLDLSSIRVPVSLSKEYEGKILVNLENDDYADIY